MEPSLDTFAAQVERHLKETNRPDEAAALKQQGWLTRLLNLLIIQLVSTSELKVTGIEQRLGERYNRNTGLMPRQRPDAFLTPIGAGRQALVVDFEALASHIGELSMTLQNGCCEGADEGSELNKLLSELRTRLNQLSAKPPEARLSVTEALDELESPGDGLSEAYRHADFSSQGSWFNPDFLRK
jgi:hypothetical protein